MNCNRLRRGFFRRREAGCVRPCQRAYAFFVLRHEEEKATRPGFEPGQREPKSLVLPLHYRVRRSVHGAVLNLERELFQLHRQIDGHQAHLRGQPQYDRGEVQ
jgi:hypothetical protein